VQEIGSPEIPNPLAARKEAIDRVALVEKDFPGGGVDRGKFFALLYIGDTLHEILKELKRKK